ncbi:hypothetical protein BGZ83_002432 [Gryganskiella cystojenkinii]|nr:hypothetical protein BGZ83_002432 [Gryganskiella cystojenkinii]
MAPIPAKSTRHWSSQEVFQTLADHPLDVEIQYKIQSRQENNQGFYAVIDEDDPSVIQARILNVLPEDSRIVDHVADKLNVDGGPAGHASCMRQLILTSRIERLSAQSCIRILELTLSPPSTHDHESESTPASAVVVFQSLKASLPISFESKALFANGYQSWSASYAGADATSTFENPNWLYGQLTQLPKASDEHIFKYAGVAGKVHSNLVTVIRDQVQETKVTETTILSARPEEVVLCGSLSEDVAYTYFLMDTNSGTMTLFHDCLGKKIESRDEKLTFKTLFTWSDQDTVVWDHYSTLWKSQFSDRRSVQDSLHHQISGWTSWYLHYDNITEPILLDNLRHFTSSTNSTLGGWPATVFQIDDGWTVVGDWLECKRDTFPSGMRSIAEAIQSRGLIPGLWLAPFLASRKSKIIHEHPDWFLKKPGFEGHRPDLKPLPIKKGFRLNCCYLPSDAGIMMDDPTSEYLLAHPAFQVGTYALDLENPEVRDHLARVFHTVTKEFGFRMLKLDFLFAAALLPRNGKSRGQLMWESMQMIRTWCGPDIILLGCGAPLGACFMVTDFCRIGADVGPSWDSIQSYLHDREYVSCFNSLTSTLSRWAMSGRFFGNDPDVYFIRDWSMGLNRTERRTLMILNHLLGHLVFSSDPFDTDNWKKDQRELADAFFPWPSTPDFASEGSSDEAGKVTTPLPFEIVRVLQPIPTVKDLYLIQVKCPASLTTSGSPARTIVVVTNMSSKKQIVHLSVIDRILSKQEDKASSGSAKQHQASVYFHAESGQFGSSAAAYSIKSHDTAVFLRVVDTAGQFCGLEAEDVSLHHHKVHRLHLPQLHLHNQPHESNGLECVDAEEDPVYLVATKGGHVLPLTEIESFSHSKSKTPHQYTIRFRPSRLTTKQVQVWLAWRNPSTAPVDQSTSASSRENLVRKQISPSAVEHRTINGVPLQLHPNIQAGPGIVIASAMFTIHSN